MHRTGALILMFTVGVGVALSQTNIHGTVRDAAGTPAANATVMLTCDETPGLSAHTATSADGTFLLHGVAACRYHMSAQQKQRVTATLALTIDATSRKELEVNLTLGAEGASGTDGASRPKFAASGIRGLIDPGGYSAPANAAAASGLLTGMAEVNRARTPSGTGCSKSVMSELTAAHERDVHDPAATMNLAEALIVQEQFEQARVLLLSLPDAHSNDVRAMHLLARLDEGTGAFDAAATQYHRLAAAEPTAENAFAEGYELILAGRLEKAAIAYRESLAIYPNSSSLMIGAGTTEFLQQHTEKATTLFLKAAMADPKDPRPYPFLAAASGVSVEDGDRVIAAMKQHVAVAPEDAPGHLAFAVELLHMAKEDATDALAEAELRQSLRVDPTVAQAHYQLAMILLRRGANDEAMRELELTVRLDPSLKEAHYRLALALRRAGQPEAAALEMQRFQQARAEDVAAGANVRKYLSVMTPMMRQPGDGADPCVRR